MSLKLMTWVFHESRSKGIDKLVLLAIADHAHDDGLSAYPGMTLLAKKAGVGKGTICRAVERLADLGELEITDRQTTAKAGTKIGRGAKLAYRIITTGNVPEGNVPERNVKKVPERNDTGPEGSADARKKVPLTSSPIEEEPSSISEPKEPYVEPPARPDVDELCLLLADRIIGNGANPKTYRPKVTTKAWQNPMRLLLDDDLAVDQHGQPVPPEVRVERARKAINWCQDSVFWRKNVLCPDKLREKYDQLRLAALEEQQQSNGHHNSNGNGSYVNDDRWRPATTPRRRYGEDYTPEQKAELDRLLEDEWAGRQVLGRHLPGRTP